MTPGNRSYPFTHRGISTRRRMFGGRLVHEMADLGVDALCGVEMSSPWTYTDDPVDCQRCIAKEIKLQAKDPERERPEPAHKGNE